MRILPLRAGGIDQSEGGESPRMGGAHSKAATAFLRSARWRPVDRQMLRALLTLTLVLVGGAAFAADQAPRRMYVPAESLDVLLRRDEGGVLLPREEFEQLLREARAAGQAEPNLPAKAVLSRADYQVRLDGERLQVEIDLAATNFSGGWEVLSIPVGGFSIEEASANGEAALVTRDDPPEILKWLTSGAGDIALRLSASLPLGVVGSDRVASFDLVGAPAGTLRVTLPPGKHLQLGGLSVQRPAAVDQEAEYVLPVGGQSSVELRITDRASESHADALTFASTAFGLSVAPGEVTWTARTSLQVIGRKIDRLSASVPSELEITGVEGVGLESWELSDAGDGSARTTLTLNWRVGFDGSRTITFRGVVSSIEDGIWTVPNLRLDEVTSHTGVVEIRYPMGVRLQLQEMANARASATGDSGMVEATTLVLPDDSGSGSANRLRYEVWEQDFTLQFRMAMKERELHAAMTNLLDVTDDGLLLFTLIEASPLFDSLFELRLTLPAEWEIQELKVAEEAAVWQTRPIEAGVNEVRIALDPPLPPGQSRAVRLVTRRVMEDWPVELTPVRIALPEVRLPQASVIEALYGVTGEDDVRLTPVQTKGLDPARRGDLAALEKQLQGSARTLKLGFAYQDTVFSGQLEAVRKATRISSSTLSFVQLDRETITTHLETQVRIAGGGTRELRVSLPEEAGQDVRFAILTPVSIAARQNQQVMIAGPRIVEQSSADPADGKRVWTLKLDQRLYGDFLIWTEVRQPRGDGEISPLVLSIEGAERENGYIAVIAGEDQRITLTARDAEGNPLPLVDPVDFPAAFTFPVQHLRSGRKRLVASVQYLQSGYSASINEQRFEPAPAPTAICTAADYETLVGATGELQHEATLRILAVGVQALSVQLPDGDRLWAALVNGQPVEVRRVGEQSSIPLPGSTAGEGAYTVTLLSRGTANELGGFRRTPPRVSVTTGAGIEQPLEVLEQSWVVHHSPETVLVGREGAFYADEPAPRASLLGWVGSELRLPTQQEAIGMASVAGGVLLAVILMTWVLKRLGMIPAALCGIILTIVFSVWCVRFVSWPLASERSVAVSGGVSTQFDEFDGEGLQGWGGGGMGLNNGMPGLLESASPAPQAAAEPSSRSSIPEPAISAPGAESAGRITGDAAQRLRSNRGGTDKGYLAEQRRTYSGPVVPGLAGNAVPNAPVLDANPPSGFETAPLPEPPGSGEARPFGRQLELSRSGTMPAPQPSELNRREEGEQALGKKEKSAPEDRGALLSLTLAMAPPANFVSRTFHYRGSLTDPGEVDLDVRYFDIRQRRMLTGAIAAGVVLLFWWLRRAVIGVRAVVAVLLIAGSLAAAGIVPAAGQMLCDGLFLGGVLGVGLWMLIAVVGCCVTGCCRRGKRESASSGERPLTTIGSVGLLAALSSANFLGTVNPVQAAEQPAPDPEAGRPIVILPYESASDPLSADRVLLPRDYFLKLWKQAHPEEQPPEAAPVTGVVAAALYRAELVSGEETESTIRVEARFVVRQLADRAVQVPLPIGRVAVEASRMDDAPATLVATNEGALAVVVERAGVHVVDVTFRVPAINVTKDAGRFVLPLKPVSAGRMSFALPGGEETEVRINGATDGYRVSEEDGRRVVSAPVDRGGEITVAWRPRLARGAAGDGSLSVESTIGATADDAGLTVRQRFRFVVSQGSLGDVTFAIPAHARVKRIAGADVAGWEQNAEGGDAERSLKIFLRRDVPDSTSLDIDLFQEQSWIETASQVIVPTLRPVGVTREQGDVAVFAEPQLLVQAGGGPGLRQVNVATFTMDAALTQPGASARAAYRFSARPLELSLSISRRRPETRVQSEHGVQVLLRKVRVASRLQFDLREAAQATLSIHLPQGFLPLSVQGDYLSDWTVMEGDAGRMLTVELDQPRTGRVQVLLEGMQLREGTQNRLTVSLPQPRGIQRQESQLGIWIEDLFTSGLGESADWRSLDPAQLPDEIRELRAGLPQYGLRSTQLTPGEIPIDLQRAQAELSGEALVIAAASDAALDYGMTLRWRIDRAAADEFVVTTPDWLGEHLALEGEGIRQVVSTLLEDGRRAWRVTLHEPVRGQYLMSAATTLPLPADDRVRIPDIRFLRPDQLESEAAGLAVQQRYLVLVNLSGVHRLAAVDAGAITTVSRDQLPLRAPPALLDQAIEIASLEIGKDLPEWTLESTAGTQEASATVLLADLRTVLGRDGSWRTQADYRVRNRGRQFLAIVPPEGARLLSLIVRDQPSRVIPQEVNGMRLWLAPLPATSSVDLSFQVRLVLAGRLPGGLPDRWTLAARELELPAPQVASATQSPEFGLPVLQTLWRIDVPDDLTVSLVESGGRSNLTPGDDDAAEHAYGKSALEELKTQLGLTYLRDLRDSARRASSKDVYYNLGKALEDVEQLNDEQRRLLGEQSELIAEAGRKLKELEVQQDAPQSAADDDVSLNRNDNGREFVIGNNFSILSLNGIGIESAGSSEAEFDFSLNARISGSLSQGKGQTQERQQDRNSLSRAEVRSQLQEQELSYRKMVPGIQPTRQGHFGDRPNVRFGASSAAIRSEATQDAEASGVGGLALDGVAPRATEWTQAGGMSLDFALPRRGRELTFAKVGGDPRLTLAIRSGEATEFLFGLGWAVACLVLGVIALQCVTSRGPGGVGAVGLLAGIGLLGALLLPSPLRFAVLVLFLAGAGWLVARWVARAQST